MSFLDDLSNKIKTTFGPKVYEFQADDYGSVKENLEKDRGMAAKATEPKKKSIHKYNKHTPEWVKPILNTTAEKYGVPTAILSNQQFKESSFKKNAVSSAGATGISQFMPATAKAYGLKVDDKIDERLIPEKAIDAQARLMKDLKNKYGSWEKALSAYNSGNPNAYKDPTFSNGETYNYVKDIMKMLKDDEH